MSVTESLRFSLVVPAEAGLDLERRLPEGPEHHSLYQLNLSVVYRSWFTRAHLHTRRILLSGACPGHSFHGYLLMVHRCTRAQSLHPPPSRHNSPRSCAACATATPSESEINPLT